MSRVAHTTYLSDLKVFEEELRINTVAPIHLVRTFLPLIRKGNAKKVVLVTSNLGSVELAVHTATLAITYSITKAGLNMCVSECRFLRLAPSLVYL